jgi:hypothetical protein
MQRLYFCKEITSLLLKAFAIFPRNSREGIRLSLGLSSLEIACWLVLISLANCACVML